MGSNQNRKLLGEGIPQVFQAFPWPWPFDLYSLLHSQKILMSQVSPWPMSQPGVVAMTAGMTVGMTAASCKCLPIVAQLKAPIDSQEAAPFGNSIKTVKISS